MSNVKKDKKILIVGAGVFGLSTAYHLAKVGYSNVTVIDRGETVPSIYSAGHDLNKIMRVEYEDDFYTDLALSARDAWLSPTFAPYYRECGYLVTTSKDSPVNAKRTLQDSFKSITRPGSKIPNVAVETFNSWEELKAIVPQLQGPAMQWKGYINRFAGYVQAARAMEAVHMSCRKMGVTFILGQAGYAVELLMKQDVTGKKALEGVRTAGFQVHKADLTILALGAHAATLLPSFADQIEAKSWAVGHVQLTPAEAKDMEGIPVINCRDIGFLFEPDADTRLLKIASNCAGYVNYVDGGNGRKISVPFTMTNDIPVEDQERIRSLLRETFPALAERPLIHKCICWCADTMDSEYVIDWVPGFSSANHPSLMIAGGDSGHSFKMFPVVGEWVAQMLENGEQKIPRWAWKDYKREGSTDVSWRVGTAKDIRKSLNVDRLGRL